MREGWTRVPFGDMVRQVKDRVDPETSGLERYIAGEHMDTDDLRIRRWGRIGDGYLGPAFHMRFKPGQVLYGSRRTYLRKVAVPDFEGITANTTFVLETRDQTKLIQPLVPWLMCLDDFHAHAVKQSKGSVNPYINFSDLAWYPVWVPNDIAVQMRIVEALAASRSVIDELEHVVQRADAVRRSLSNSAFEEREGRLVEIGDVSEVVSGATPSRSHPEFWGGDIPWLPTGKVNDRVIRDADEFITSQALLACPLQLVPAGATLVAMIGEGQTRGRVAYLEIEACTNQNFAAVLPGPSLDGRFLFHQLESRYDALRAWSQGTNHHALSAGLVRRFRILCPPLARQRQIVEPLVVADQAFDIARSRLEEARRLTRMVATMLLGEPGRQ